MVTEERKAEILENRRTFERLNRAIVEAEQQRETLIVMSRSGKEREIMVHALTELDIARAAHTCGLTLQDLLKVSAASVTTTAKRQQIQINPCYFCILQNPKYTYGPNPWDYTLYELTFSQVENPNANW